MGRVGVAHPPKSSVGGPGHSSQADLRAAVAKEVRGTAQVETTATRGRVVRPSGAQWVTGQSRSPGSTSMQCLGLTMTMATHGGPVSSGETWGWPSLAHWTSRRGRRTPPLHSRDGGGPQLVRAQREGGVGRYPPRARCLHAKHHPPGRDGFAEVLRHRQGCAQCGLAAVVPAALLGGPLRRQGLQHRGDMVLLRCAAQEVVAAAVGGPPLVEIPAQRGAGRDPPPL